jgi:hypothetical protein
LGVSAIAFDRTVNDNKTVNNANPNQESIFLIIYVYGERSLSIVSGQ